MPFLITAPSLQPVAVSEMADHSVIDHAEHSALMQSFLGAAVAYLDGWSGVLGRCIGQQVWGVRATNWVREISLPFQGVTAVTVKYQDPNGVEQVLPPGAHYLCRGGIDRLVFLGPNWPALDPTHPEPILVELTAGWVSAAEVPEDIKQMIRLLAAHWYEHREAASEKAKATVPLGFDMLLSAARSGVY